MPQTTTAASPALGIRLEDGPTYAPGDTICGVVYRKAPAVSPKCTVTIQLAGRAKSKIVVSRGNNSSSTYRGRFNLIPKQGNHHKIFQGPLHVTGQNDEQVWPFAVTLPTHVNPSYLGALDQESAYIPLSTTNHPLPSTFTLHTSGFTEGFVEYFLHAQLSMMRDSRYTSAESTLPIKVNSLNPDPPIADFSLRLSRISQLVTSYRLVPGMEDAKLSFSQKMKQTFSTSSVPEFSFTLEVEVPTKLQLDNPTPLPFRVRAVPKWDKTSDVIKEIPQKIRLTHASLRICSSTEVICEGSLYPHTKDKIMEVDLNVNQALKMHENEIYIPCTDEWPPLDVGELANLHVSRQRGRAYGSLTENFTTYNIKHTHMLKWALRAEVAEETVDAMGATHLKLLPASDDRNQPRAEAGSSSQEVQPPLEQRAASWIHPPEEAEAPPSFAEVQKEDSKAEFNADSKTNGL
ncbi:hypothetical protein NM208_g12040 [Fusarium decemcellulare]|uniref:Uncharacterized protein n=1 Tax=Fusarium decemcellulare TaxID=57161 RepID=A0ACC1RQ68_9HYPO|nr:hypothetical protein NM208_g12040 [Fusarium decemcellulare]